MNRPLFYPADLGKLYSQELPRSTRKGDGSSKDVVSRKRRKTQHSDSPSVSSSILPERAEPSVFPRGTVTTDVKAEVQVDFNSHEMKNGESVSQLRKMVFGKLEYTTAQRL